MRRLLVLVLLMVVAAGVAAILLRTVARTTATDTLTVPQGVRAVDVATDTGDVRVTGRAGTGTQVAARREYSLWGPDVTDRQDGGTLVLRADCPGFGWLTACRVDYTVGVPRAAGVTADADAGAVEVAGVAGPVTATSNAGAVRATGLRARRVTATTDAGDVDVQVDVVPVRVEARSRAGDVRVTVPRGRYRVDADSTTGDVRLEGVVRDPSAAAEIVATTNAGDVVLQGR